MAPKGSATTTPTIPSNSPAPLSGTQAASGGTPARSTSPSKYVVASSCARDQDLLQALR
ncbi:hypothetical protein EXIGLDRAFT_429105 [Exidia glandulosa HHB12029]|uniref:Uncharacterized protein n=1 Tax=Exidia glandulosa HHB12029 TaxID=1314781 RepID=A0A165KJN7_EXIGL|nr:hypothetical protein EXIGLDRAFT_429105 [Exidia glandulosa HHB12029]